MTTDTYCPVCTPFPDGSPGTQFRPPHCVTCNKHHYPMPKIDGKCVTTKQLARVCQSCRAAWVYYDREAKAWTHWCRDCTRKFNEGMVAALAEAQKPLPGQEELRIFGLPRGFDR